ncbi:hypothetical protein KAS79_00410 [Candidatus Parcubacteria bacterium]|nr:hypothetical protein [Candidatus Parcubacteria bacterium]
MDIGLISSMAILFLLGMVGLANATLAEEKNRRAVSAGIGMIAWLALGATATTQVMDAGSPAGIDELKIGGEYHVNYVEYSCASIDLLLQAVEEDEEKTEPIHVRIERSRRQDYLNQHDMVIVTNEKNLKITRRHDNAMG